MVARFLGVGWGFPVAKGPSQAPEEPPAVGAIVPAEYEQCVRQAIWIVLSTAKGERVMRPDFGCGIHDLVFAPNDAATRGLAVHEVSEALLRWEPRIQVIEIEASAHGHHDEELLIDVDYRVIATDNRFNLVYPFYLQRGEP